MKSDSNKLRSSLFLLLAAVIWGFAFAAQSVGMEYIGSFTFTSVRFILGAAVLLPVVWVMRRGKARALPEENRACLKLLLRGGVTCGVFLCIATNLQQFGIKYTTVGKAGFITAFYIVLVPVFGLFLKKNCSPLIWAAVALSVVGLYLLCIRDGFSLGKGDALVMLCAVFFAFQILSVDHFSPLVSGIELSICEFLVCAVLSGIPALLFEQPSVTALLAAWKPVLYTGIFSSGIAYTLQILGQKGLHPAVASLIMSLESCISVLAGWLILGQKLSRREIAGCVIMFAAILLAQVPDTKEKNDPKKSLPFPERPSGEDAL